MTWKVHKCVLGSALISVGTHQKKAHTAQINFLTIQISETECANKQSLARSLAVRLVAMSDTLNSILLDKAEHT